MLPSRFVFLPAVLFFVVSTCPSGLPQRFIPVEGQTEASENNPASRTIWISVHSKNGSSPELNASDFEVKLDGKPASISNVRRVSPTLHYCLLLDISGSTRSTRNAQHDEAVALLSKIPRANHDYGLLVYCNS